MNNLTTLTTEMRNQNTMTIDSMSTAEILTTINREDMTVAKSVQQVLPEVEKTVEVVYQQLKNGGKLLYVGAGTSGRIGILDAVECPPTYSTAPEVVQAVMAGGINAIEKAVEGAEDDEDLGANDLKERHLTKNDVVIGIAASGRTPYVIGALKYAKQIGATTISLASNKNAVISQYADIKIEVVTGPEILTGSTRMKAATAHKMILNMITTTAMIKIGKVYENLMVDLKVSNHKLKERAKNIVSTITETSYETATTILEETNYEVKPAIVMIRTGVTLEEAKKYIQQADGFVRVAIELATKGGK
ncbi:N-acetylmuramic acid 6-phosphate etherase [Ornithinibacillus halotolerans]|uniref:N-acetylmuramic acid 6-phosphate etherase n=1 Tax=Ornithinibacillus halotolerans TaxID=1274357 RepID=A0A916W514_9BACI|nr:N-acetylmuramic acid 6-phosphate etherase [Ornithinibacillus halotolerans]GGA66677.1 N-acetylmuramic acid 6-phosphate etherase [Ornithinibacillus halotolerans]